MVHIPCWCYDRIWFVALISCSGGFPKSRHPLWGWSDRDSRPCACVAWVLSSLRIPGGFICIPMVVGIMAQALIKEPTIPALLYQPYDARGPQDSSGRKRLSHLLVQLETLESADPKGRLYTKELQSIVRIVGRHQG